MDKSFHFNREKQGDKIFNLFSKDFPRADLLREIY